MTAPLTLKNPKGWFAAGLEMERAIHLLSDGSFKLFVHICLQARRDTGCLETVQNQLAEALHRSRGCIARQLKELKTAGVCQVPGGHSPKDATWIEVASDYWPYHRSTNMSADESTRRVDEIRQLLLARACVRTSFSPADEHLVRTWFSQGISLEQIGQAILLGCARKYTSWRNGQERGTIASLRYFEPILQELTHQPLSPDYWQYIRAKLERMEKQWVTVHRKQNGDQPKNPPSTNTILGAES